ncbi:MAG: hypothetical protein QW318_07490 [Candidatus Caldarchaeum sp.]
MKGETMQTALTANELRYIASIRNEFPAEGETVMEWVCRMAKKNAYLARKNLPSFIVYDKEDELSVSYMHKAIDDKLITLSSNYERTVFYDSTSPFPITYIEVKFSDKVLACLELAS